MLKIYNCITEAHDLRLVVLAAIICVLATLAAINLLHHARKSQGQLRNGWLAVSAISTGFGIWATHFVAMLAFTPGIPAATISGSPSCRWSRPSCSPASGLRYR